MLESNTGEVVKEPSLLLYVTDAAELDLPLLVECLLIGSTTPGNLKRGWVWGIMGGGTAGWKDAGGGC